MVDSVTASRDGVLAVLSRAPPVRSDGGEQKPLTALTGAGAGAGEQPPYRLSLSETGRKMTLKRNGGEELRGEILRLQQNDASIKSHEMAHLLVGGGYSGGISFSYQQGPDGREYVSGGEVSISVSMGSTPEETIRNMRKLKQAALAPLDPSPQDVLVALQAAAVISRMQRKLSRTGSTEGDNSFPLSMQEMLSGLAPPPVEYIRGKALIAYRQNQEPAGDTVQLQWSA